VCVCVCVCRVGSFGRVTQEVIN